MSVSEASAKIFAALIANPNVVGHNPSCGWSPVNTTWPDLASLAVHLAERLEAAQPTLTSPAAPSPEVKPFTPTKSTWQAGVEFRRWLNHNTTIALDNAQIDRIAEKALKIFSECGAATPDAFQPSPAFVAPERPDTLIRQKSDGFECWASKRAGGYCAGPWCYSFDSVDVINPATGEPLAPADDARAAISKAKGPTHAD
jgi:hypothetical protein